MRLFLSHAIITTLVLTVFATSCKPAKVSYRKGDNESGAASQAGDDQTQAPTTATETTPAGDDGDVTPIPGKAVLTYDGGPITTKDPVTIDTVGVTPIETNFTYQWRTKSGPAELIFSPTNTKDTIISATTDGEYIAELIVTNSEGQVTTLEIPITWDTTPPLISGVTYHRTMDPVATSVAVTDQSPVTYKWTSIMGPVTFDDDTKLNPTITKASDGIGIAELKATDALGNSATFHVVIEMYSPSAGAPSVAIDETLYIKTPTAVSNVTATGGETPYTYNWVQAAGPSGKLVITTNNVEKPTFSATQDGIYAATLNVSGANNATANATLLVTWDTTPPVISYTYTRSENRLDTPRQIGLKAEDNLSAQMTYSWQQVSGPGTMSFSDDTQIDPIMTANQAGTYRVAVTATDRAGNAATKTMDVIWVVRDREAPVIGGINTPRVYTGPTRVDGITVTDADPNLTYMWKHLHGPAVLTFNQPDEKHPEVNSPAYGSHLAKLTVTDSVGNQTIAYVVFVFESPDKQPPVITGLESITTSVPAKPNALQVTDDSSVSYRWEQLNKDSAPGILSFSDSTAMRPYISASAAGAYIAQITATDEHGNQAVAQLAFVWQVIDATAPKITMGPALIIETPTQPEVSVTDDDSDTLRYEWTQLIGPNNAQLIIQNPTDLKPTFSATVAGVYILKFTVWDSSNNKSIETLRVEWVIPDTEAPVIDLLPEIAINQPTPITTITIIDDSPIARILWEQIDGPGTLTIEPNDVMKPTFSADKSGKYRARISVWDAAGNKSEKEITIIWDTDAPIVNAGPDQTIKTKVANLDQATVTDLTATTVNWTIYSKPAGSTGSFDSVAKLRPAFTASKSGTYVLKLTATDALGNKASDTVTITVKMGTFIPAVAKHCPTVCRNAGLQPGNPIQCVSGEVRPDIAFENNVHFRYGCWRSCVEDDRVVASSSYSIFCYQPGQKHDSDHTDITVACFCQ